MTIRSVSEHEIRVGDRRWSQTIALTTDGVVDDWANKPIEALTEDDFSSLLGTGTEMIVLGTGSRYILPPRHLVFAFARRGIGFEVMDTRAAARTFNVLVGEGRPVAAVLYL